MHIESGPFPKIEKVIDDNGIKRGVMMVFGTGGDRNMKNMAMHYAKARRKGFSITTFLNSVQNTGMFPAHFKHQFPLTPDECFSLEEPKIWVI